MARRKGSGRGKSTVNSRSKSTLENAREKLRDDPGGTKKDQTETVTNLSNMEATTATTPAATTTTKYYNKTKLQQQNNNNQHLPQNKSTTATTNSSKKAQQQQQQQTYRDLEDRQEPQKKLTAKQAKQAAKLEAQQKQQQQNVKNADSQQQQQRQQQQQHNKNVSKTVTSSVLEKEKSITNSNLPATTTNIAPQQQQHQPTTATTTTANNANKNINSNLNVAKSSTSASVTTTNNSGSSMDYVNSISNSSNFNKSDTTTSSNSNNKEQLSNPTPNSTSDNFNSAGPGTGTGATGSDNNWSNSKYLHKKFKRLASTTETDGGVGQDAEKLRTTSISSASSSVSSPPPPSTPASAIVQPQNETTKPAHETNPQQQHHNLQNGYLSQQEVVENAVLQNKILLQMAQQQQVVANNTSTSNNPAELSNGPNSSASSATATNASGGSGRYICPYCNLSCTKPSVLQKHIRAHTNERPYPCDICGIAFKTKSNLYKHCRSRSHAARQKGIEVPPDADDGLSDQDVDPELSNSSSEMLSRTDSPMEDVAIVSQIQQQQQQMNEPHTLIPTPMNSNSSIGASPLPASPAPRGSAHQAGTQPQPSPIAHQQQQQQHQSQLPLGSPAAGTLAPTSATINQNNVGGSNSSAAKQAIDYKPYKPKFHNAALYNSPKEAAAAAAAAATTNIVSAETNPTPAANTRGEIVATSQPPPQTKQPEMGIVPGSTGVCLPQALNHQQYQQILIEAQKYASSQVGHSPAAPIGGGSAAGGGGGQPPSSVPHQLHHHPTLSPSTQIKLNNHISSHQLQQQLQQQQQQLHQLAQAQAAQHPHHLLAPPPANALSLPLAAAAYYLGPPPGAFYNPMTVAHQQAFASLHLMTQQEQQQFRHQLQLQQHLQQLQHSGVITPATVVAAPQPPPPPSQPTPLIAVAQSGPQTASSPSPGQNHIKTHTPVLGNTGVVRPTPTSVNNTALHLSKPSPAAIPATNVPQQSPLHYLASAALNSQPVATVANNKLAGEIVSSEPLQQQHQMSNSGGHQRPNANHNSQNSNNAGEVPLNKENLHERINKIISQNEAIVENKELLLQKKYPKTLNRSRSFTNANNSAASGSSAGSTQTLQSTTGGPPSESPTNAKLAQVIVQKQQLQQQQQQQQQLQQQQQQYLYQQQLQQQQQQMQKQRHMYSEKVNMEDVVLPLNGTSKNVMSKHLPNQSQTQALPPQSNQPLANQGLHPSQMHPYRGPNSTTNTQANSQHQTPASTNSPAMANVPLNLSAKSKAPIVVEERIDLSTSKQPQGPLPQQPPPATPRKRHSIEQASQPTAIVNPVALNEASNSSNSNSQAAHQATAVASSSSSAPAAGKYAPNHSIIKNLLLNARGLAVPMGEGEDAVYICPLCSTEFRTAEDLQLHNSAYCQGNNSSANSPASSPSHKYFRSSSIHSLNMSDLKILSKNPLSLAKLAWSQLKIKPSNLVLDRLSASQANTSKSNSSTTTSETSTQPSCSTTTQLAAGTSNSTLTNQSTSTSSSNNSGATAAKSHLALNDIPIRFVDAPLPSPGPLLGKTPLVDYTPNDTKHKSEEVIITKMHDDRMYTNMNFNEHHHHATVVASSASSLAINNKRLKFETSANNKRLTNITSGGEMQPLNPLELSKKEERLKRFTSSGGCMIPLSECDDVDKSPKMIRTPLLSGGSFQEVSPKKETKLPVPLIQGAQLTPKLALGLSTSSSGPQHFQFPPINQITAFNPLTLPLTEKVIPYVPGIPGPNSLTPQMHLPQQPQPQQQQQLHLQVPPQQKPRTVSPNRKLALSPNEPGTSSNKSVTTFGGVQNVPSEFSKAPPTANMRNVKNWNSTSGSSSNKLNLPVAAAGGEAKQSSKSFNFLRMADNLSPRKLMAETETRHFNLERVAKDQLNIQQPTSVSNIGGAQALSPTAATSSSTLTPLHVDTSPGQVGPNESAIIMESKPKSKFLRPTSLPLRPGTFTPKRHHGITPTANTLPLISPETPRPSKECVQLYLNGNSYTYLGLKSSTKTFYCTLNCPQPSYVQDMHKLSMYSMWQQCAENNPHPLGLKPKEVMSLYDSRQKVQIYNMAESKKLAYTVVDAQQMVMTPFLSSQDKFYHHQLKRVAVSEEESAANKEDNKSTGVEHRDSSQMSNNSASTSSSSSQTLVGGYESNENYTYIRGRGRGKYVCSECGIRCKKPSMLKKHIRTHTDVRPYTCKHCNFSFKTKGNLTKHMQSKTHYKKCIELGLNPGPMPADGEFLEPDMEFDQQSSTSAGGRTSSMGNAESDTDGDSSDNETESSNESDSAAVTRSSVPSSVAPPSITVNAASEDNKSHLEHEAARCLLSLSMTPPIHSQSTETSGQIVVTTVMATSATATTTTPSAIRRVVSYTSPKPPFDYQKQEQYYSNPEEAMPKNKAINNFEAAPMDLTKPRSSDVSVTTVNSLPATVLVHASLQNSSSNNKQPSLSSLPGPVQTQAQIDDVIFGGNRDESGLLKTMISVSSKVARSQPGISEEVRNLNEDMMLYDYRREQTLQYNKIKQTQLSRSLASTANEVATTTTMASSNAYVNAMSSSTATTVTQVCSSISSVAATVISSRDSAIVSSGVTTTPAVTTAAIMGEKSKTEIPVQVPKIEVVEPVEQSPRTKSNEVSSSAFHPTSVTNVEIRKPPPANQTKTSSDESEETDDEPPAKKHLTMGSEEKISGHNSNLPAAVLQPGTTDFSGVLSGGSNSSSSAGGASSQLPTRTVIVGEDGFTTTNNEILPVHPKVPPLTNADGRPVCSICSKTFQKQPQLILHMNIHYMERKYKCDPCGVSFRTQGHLQKHERSEAHKNKVIMTSTFGVPTTSNPRPFECTDCKIAFRIHGHLAKHLRSKTHVQKLECLQKLPFGTYAEIERAGISLTEIDTSDCENSLISLRLLAQKLIEKDPSSKLGSYTTPSGVQDNNSNTGLVSQDSASEDGFQAAASAAASAIASLDNDSAANTPRRANSTSEDESIAMALNSNLKRRLPGAFSNGDDSDKDIQDDKRLRQDLGGNHQMQSAASPPAN